MKTKPKFSIPGLLAPVSLMLFSALTGGLECSAERIHISTPSTSMVLDGSKGSPLYIMYYGAALSDNEMNSFGDSGMWAQNAYPVYGLHPYNESALAMTHADGNMTLDMEVADIERTSTDGADITTVTLQDKVYPVTVKLNYKTYPGEDVIETWSEITNKEKGNVTLTQFASGHLPIRVGDVWLSSLYGSWGNEGRIETEPLTHGMKVIQNKDGVRNSHSAHSEVMISLDGKPQENTGRVIGAALAYSGNYKLRFDTNSGDHHLFFAGINEENSAYHLKKGETFTTPHLALPFSKEGLSGASRNFHKWGRNHMIAHGNTPRKVLLNSWEGVYFNINEAGMSQMMNDIASMGGELFVMDDGWFGDKYPRKGGDTALGDWIVDTEKLPHGIQGLIDTAEKNGIKFGIWIEPEMVNSKSRLYEKHPEYIIKAANREPVMGRGGTQMVLDLANPKVQDIVFEVVDTLLTNYPGLDYIKWDANAPVMNHGSQYQTSDNQSHLYIDYHKGLAKVLDRIRAKYPDITIQACGAGGGRANYGFLPWFDEFWTSDDTDALQRVYLQWGHSYFFPPLAMASHISASPNHQTRRSIPIKYRIDVAMSGRLGMEIQPKDMSEEDKDICRKAISEYKQIRPVVQFGDIYRLLSPYDGKGAASMMMVSPEKDEAVFYWWKTEAFVNQQLPKIRLAGLDPDKTYVVTELNRIDKSPMRCEGKEFTGRFLMDNGLEMPSSHDIDYHKRTEYASRVLHLKAK